MQYKLVYNLIVSYFLNLNVRYLTVFNCWSFEEKFNFIMLANSKLIAVRYIQLSANSKKFEAACNCERNEGFVLEYSCMNASIALAHLSDLKCFSSKNFWLIYETERTGNSLVEQLKDTNLNVDTHLTYTKPMNSSHVFQLLDVYNNGKILGGELNITFNRILNCNPEDCVTEKFNPELSNKSLYSNRLFLSDLTMRVATVITTVNISQPHDVLMNFLDSISNPYMDNIPRYGHRLITVLGEMLRYNKTWFHRNKWTENYTSGGVLGDIKSQKIDQSISPFILDLPRLMNVSIVFTPCNFRTMFIFRSTDNDGLIGSSFTKPFQFGVWLCLIGAILVFGTFLNIVFSIERNLGAIFELSYLLTVLNTFGLFCQQSSFVVPRSSGGRIVYVFLLITCFLLYNFYTSIIVSFLLESPRPSNIKTLRDLANSKLEIGIESTAYIRSYLSFRQPEIEYLVEKKVVPLKDPSTLWLKSNEGIIKTRKPGYAYSCDSNIAYRFVEQFYEPHEICDLNEVDLLPRKHLGFLLDQGSPYKEIYRLKFIKMLETGIVSKHHRYWFKQRPLCLSNNVIKSVEVEYMAPLFIMLAISFCISLILLLVENVYGNLILH